ncbi:hypothetical protein PAPYR_1797 [Paratrimastix pyriformis]|uniref:FYVE-type domain-containing protein n=1 Tax=Paratrimastix pyriformis TaxID=342808 RepID=A0ABQ8UWE9_9EUKA|nr:hypothetical protein PAPYR_1797 [Paratrimastix pyriformis]
MVSERAWFRALLNDDERARILSRFCRCQDESLHRHFCDCLLILALDTQLSQGLVTLSLPVLKSLLELALTPADPAQATPPRKPPPPPPEDGGLDATPPSRPPPRPPEESPYSLKTTVRAQYPLLFLRDVLSLVWAVATTRPALPGAMLDQGFFPLLLAAWPWFADNVTALEGLPAPPPSTVGTPPKGMHAATGLGMQCRYYLVGAVTALMAAILPPPPASKKERDLHQASTATPTATTPDATSPAPAAPVPAPAASAGGTPTASGKAAPGTAAPPPPAPARPGPSSPGPKPPARAPAPAPAPTPAAAAAAESKASPATPSPSPQAQAAGIPAGSSTLVEEHIEELVAMAQGVVECCEEVLTGPGKGASAAQKRMTLPQLKSSPMVSVSMRFFVHCYAHPALTAALLQKADTLSLLKMVFLATDESLVEGATLTLWTLTLSQSRFSHDHPLVARQWGLLPLLLRTLNHPSARCKASAAVTLANVIARTTAGGSREPSPVLAQLRQSGAVRIVVAALEDLAGRLESPEAGAALGPEAVPQAEAQSFRGMVRSWVGFLKARRQEAKDRKAAAGGPPPATPAVTPNPAAVAQPGVPAAAATTTITTVRAPPRRPVLPPAAAITGPAVVDAALEAPPPVRPPPAPRASVALATPVVLPASSRSVDGEAVAPTPAAAPPAGHQPANQKSGPTEDPNAIANDLDTADAGAGADAGLGDSDTANNNNEADGAEANLLGKLRSRIARGISVVTSKVGTPREALRGPTLWVPDEDTSRCMLCQEPFTFFFRRHHCRSCGSVVCSRCSPHSVIIPSLGDKAVRICNVCKQTEWKDAEDGGQRDEDAE